MNNFKKLGALLLALVLVLSLAVPAFADDTVPASGIVDPATGSKIVIQKELTAFNPAGSTVNAPTITYSYSIAPGEAGKTIKDGANVTTQTVAGPTGATITETLSWDAATAADRLATAAAGEANKKTLSVDLSDVTFPAAGVYRYVITETATFTNTGVVDGNDHVRYLDVYVKNAATAGQYVIYGYVLFTNNNNIDGSAAAADADKPDEAKKTEGFVGANADKYYTYNLTVSKTLESDPGMNGHEFPFGLSFTGTETNVLPIIAKTGTATIPTWGTKGAMSSFNTTVDGATLKIAHGGSVTVTGIPVGTKVEIVEKNDVTGTTYTAASTGADTNAEAKLVAPTESSNTATVNAQTAGSEADKTVAFTNTLALISPTGVVLRVAPYALMLAAGIVLLVLSRKRRASEEA